MRNTEGNSAGAKLDTLDLAQLVCGLLASNPVHGVSALGVEHKAEVLAGLVDGDDIHQTCREGGVGADLAVNLDEALHEDRLDLTGIEGVLQAVSQEDDEGQRVAKLVGTGRSLGGIGTGELVEKPVRGRAEALLVLLTVLAGQRICESGGARCILKTVYVPLRAMRFQKS